MLLRRFLTLSLLLCAVSLLRGQERALTTFETGAVPVGVPILGADGNLYGTTSKGGNADRGTAYRLTPDGTITTLASFTGPNGSGPTAALTRGPDGNFYGTTGKGNYDDGTIFRLTPDGVVTTLYVFPQNDRYAPSALTLGPDGSFYGLLPTGGKYYHGGAFRFTPPGTFKVIADFNDATGYQPTAPLLLGRDGNFYGATTYNGAKVFRLTPAGSLTLLASIDSSVAGGPSSSPLVEDVSGNLYGVLAGNYPANAAIFKLTPGGAYTLPARFGAAYSGDPYPFPALALGADGNLYGTTPGGDGGTGTGTVFRLTPNGAFTTLLRFNPAQGARLSGLRLAPDGTFYGTAQSSVTSSGDYTDLGSIFRVTTTGAVTTVGAFDSHTSGRYPSGGLLRAADGNFYGVTNEGGPNYGGNVYRVTPAGARTTLAEFTSSNGGVTAPRGKLCPDAAGTRLYGVGAYGGNQGNGGVYSITLDGALSTVFTFSGANGSQPRGSLVRGTDDAFYGVTSAGGATSNGTVFRLTAMGALTTLRSFNGTTDGGSPYTGLTVGADGAIYGMTNYGGANYRGTVFRVTAAGDFTVLASLPAASNGPTDAPLLCADDGNLYGVTTPGGADYSGSVFRVTPTGAYSTLVAFSSANLSAYQGGLTQGTDGNFYGACLGPYSGEPVLFRLTKMGMLTPLRIISGASQAAGGSVGAPVFGADGTLYGVGNHAVWHVPVALAADTWRQRYFGSAANAGLAADNADPDGDGVTNLLERAFGGNPLVSDAPMGPTVALDANNGRLLLGAGRGVEATDLTFTAEASADLVTWSAADVAVLYNGARFFQARDNGAAGARRYLRLRVTRP